MCTGEDFRFTAGICVYGKDNAEWFDIALDSITTRQTVRPDELVIVADGPLSEKLNQVIEKYKVKFANTHVYRLKKNMGLGAARRLLVDKSSFEYVAVMDSDDVSADNRFEIQRNYLLEHSDVDITGGSIAEFIDNIHNVISIRRVPTADKEIKEYMKERCPMNHVSVMFRKSSVTKAGSYKSWLYDEDYYLWIRMFENGAVFGNVEESLVYVRVGKDMYKRRGGWRYFQSEYRLQKYMKNHKVIGNYIYIKNVIKRFIVQMMMPAWVRKIVYMAFARSSK